MSISAEAAEKHSVMETGNPGSAHEQNLLNNSVYKVLSAHAIFYQFILVTRSLETFFTARVFKAKTRDSK